MKLTFTRQEFLKRWRALRGFAPMRNDASISRSDGLDFDLKLEAEMDAWYRNLLLTAHESLLAPVDIARDYILPDPEEGCVTLALPAEAVRLTRVRLSEWRRPATIVTDPDCNLALRQLHPYTRACASNPVAVVHPDGTVDLYPASGLDSLVTLQCVMLRPDEFAMDSAALDSI